MYTYDYVHLCSVKSVYVQQSPKIQENIVLVYKKCISVSAF